MRLPEPFARATATTTPTVAPASARSGSPRPAFGALIGEVRGDVADFIENGSGDGFAPDAAGFAAPMLSAEGQALRGSLAALPGAGGAAGPGAAAGPIDSEAQQDFLVAIAPWAEEAGQRLGVAPQLVAAHAALESGWGQKPLRRADGADTHNMFGIKAGDGWRGDVADSLTTEHQGGVALKKVERFRSYPDSGAAFRDYAQMLLDNPRYRGALGAGSDAQAFANGLARGGYATDPAYAAKLSRLASRIQSAAE